MIIQAKGLLKFVCGLTPFLNVTKSNRNKSVQRRDQHRLLGIIKNGTQLSRGYLFVKVANGLLVSLRKRSSSRRMLILI